MKGPGSANNCLHVEIARPQGGEPPARTVVFAAWTAGKKGLLGSEFYAAHPLHPLATIAAVINLDPHVVLPAVRNVDLIGGGRIPLEDDFARALRSIRSALDLGGNSAGSERRVHSRT